MPCAHAAAPHLRPLTGDGKGVELGLYHPRPDGLQAAVHTAQQRQLRRWGAVLCGRAATAAATASSQASCGHQGCTSRSRRSRRAGTDCRLGAQGSLVWHLPFVVAAPQKAGGSTGPGAPSAARGELGRPARSEWARHLQCCACGQCTSRPGPVRNGPAASGWVDGEDETWGVGWVSRFLPIEPDQRPLCPGSHSAGSLLFSAFSRSVTLAFYLS